MVGKTGGGGGGGAAGGGGGVGAVAGRVTMPKVHTMSVERFLSRFAVIVIVLARVGIGIVLGLGLVL